MLPMPDTLTHSQTTEYSATQLVSSIKHKLSHAIEKFKADGDDAEGVVVELWIVGAITIRQQ